MSGIVGLYELQGDPCSPSPARPTRMLDALAHRGPDGQQLWQKDALVLGHAALHTTAEARHEEWPLVSPDGTRVLIADARIDNRDELIAALQPRLNEDAVVTDAMLILAAYEEWGRDCAGRLIGDFAFALWDENRGHLFCARDAIGVRPFYYVFDAGQRFAFASEIKALLALDPSLARLNEEQITDVLVGLCTNHTDTVYTSIHRLPPGHTATVTPNGLRVDRYWSLDPERKIRFDTDAEYAEAFRRLFDEAVRCRLRSSTPVGALLSGGLDSSSIVVTARELGDANASLHTFSTVFDDYPSCDERAYIEAVTQRGGAISHQTTGDSLSPVRLLDELSGVEDQPYGAPNLGMSRLQYAAARDEGVRVLLDGHGGDEVVSHGDGRLFELALDGRWWALLRELRGLRRTQRLASVSELFWTYAWGVGIAPWLQRHPRLHGLWDRARHWWHRLWGGEERDRASPRNERDILSAALRARTDIDERYAAHRRDRQRPVVEVERHARLLQAPLQVHGFEVLDPLSAAFGVETRYPFWDRRLVEFCLALPSDQKLRHGWDRFVLREAMRGRLPESIRRRAAKTDFLPVLFDGMMREKRTLHTLLFSPSAEGKEYVEKTEIQQIWSTVTASEATTVPAPDLFTTWTVATLMHWLQQRPSLRNERSIPEEQNRMPRDRVSGESALRYPSS